jgi:hypothetical protein
MNAAGVIGAVAPALILMTQLPSRLCSGLPLSTLPFVWLAVNQK